GSCGQGHQRPPGSCAQRPRRRGRLDRRPARHAGWEARGEGRGEEGERGRDPRRPLLTSAPPAHRRRCLRTPEAPPSSCAVLAVSSREPCGRPWIVVLVTGTPRTRQVKETT